MPIYLSRPGLAAIVIYRTAGPYELLVVIKILFKLFKLEPVVFSNKFTMNQQ